MEFEKVTITKREILICIIITSILIGIGFLISSAIENGIIENNEKYFKALKINNDEEIFKYALNTNVGYTLIQGKVQAVDGVLIEDIEGKYFKIKKVEEHYTKHTRQVAHTRQVGDRTETYYTTETYWTWDYAGEEEWHTNKFTFLNKEFDFNTINFNNEEYQETKDGGYHIRYQYYTIPFEFEGTLFTNIKNNTINDNIFSINVTIEQIIKSKENDTILAKIAFWIVWTLVIIAIDFIYVYCENNYLED